MGITRCGRSIAAIAAATALLAACGGAGGDSGGSDGEPVTLTWWHNGIDEPLNSYFERVALGFEADHPNVTIENVPIQNEELKAKLADALMTGASRTSSSSGAAGRWASRWPPGSCST